MGLKSATKKKPMKKMANGKKARKSVVLVPKYKARGQYRIVESDSHNIMPSSNETRTED